MQAKRISLVESCGPEDDDDDDEGSSPEASAEYGTAEPLRLSGDVAEPAL